MRFFKTVGLTFVKVYVQQSVDGFEVELRMRKGLVFASSRHAIARTFCFLGLYVSNSFFEIISDKFDVQLCDFKKTM